MRREQGRLQHAHVPGLRACHQHRRGPSRGTALVQAADVSFLTHWAPETVAKLEAARRHLFRGASRHQDHRARGAVRRPAHDAAHLGRRRDGATIAGIYDAWLPDLVKDELVAPLPEAIATDVKANWPAGVVGAASIDGTLYGIPNEIDVYALNYNKKLFEEAGIAEPPKTWDEFLAAAEKLTDKSKGQQGFGLINSWAAGVLHPFSSLLVSNGGDLVVDGKPVLDSAQAKETFELYEKLITSGYSDPAMATADANTTGPFLDSFVSGKTGMIIMANWWESALKAGMGDAFADIATAPIPVGPSGDSAALDLLLVDDRRQRQGVGRRAGRGLGLPRLAQRTGIRPERRLGHGRHPDVDGHPAVAHLRRHRLCRSARQRSVPRPATPRRSPTPRASRSCSAARSSRNRCRRRSKPCSSVSSMPPTRRRRRRPTRPRSSSATPSS